MVPRLASLSLAVVLSLGLAAPAFSEDAAAPADAAAAPEAADSPRFIAARANAGDSVVRVKFLLPIDSYEVVDDHAVLVWETNTKAWLVDLRTSPACRGLDNTIAVGIDTLSDSLNTRNGYIVGRDGIRCRITQIREVDVPAMRTAERAAQVASGG
ncbi:MAG: hypothetical protein KA196_03655 [Arenimonas sp.]|nr:hypothetical protein [Arenimonas sp.]